MTSNFKNRMAVHNSRYEEHCCFSTRGERLYYALKAYGLDDFKISVLADGLTKNQAIGMELDMIKDKHAILNVHHSVIPSSLFYNMY